MASAPTRGVVFIHSAPKGLAPHVEWALGAVLNMPVSIQWTDQPALSGMLRGEYSWVGPVGSGAQLASAIRGWEHLRYEVTEEASSGVDGSRWSHTPELGIFHSHIDSVGNMLVPEDRIRAAMEAHSDARALRHALNLALGQAWDDELEPFRYAGAGAPVRWLHRVG
ncbi:hypothetical protein BSZ39_06100 [Bowdeniella nasicola]|uniref:DUF3145 domain-containing protein n=1 Tax=Bowdeniella nasicola TaxID=208480 RepID=A0A1Q5Q2K7_9ACTO|nr:DUF3145 domain-containing protein [Bowdeniella nasicola]OKL54084.1 hypothetical protein BSZ39_06100 [Bowdeniella nasicola]